MKKKILFLMLVIGASCFGGCYARITPLSEGVGWVETDTKNDRVTVTTKEHGVVVKEVITTRESARKKTRPFRWKDDGYGYGGYGYYR